MRNITTSPPPAPDQTLAVIPRGESAQVRITATTYKDRPFVDFRLWWRPEGGSWAPSRKGVMIPADQIDAAIDALRKAQASAPGNGR